MKIAVLSESTADEAAIAVLVGGLAGTTIERVAFPEPSTRGWRGVLKSVEPVLRYVHYRTDAEALVVAVDSDESPIHRMQRDAGARAPKSAAFASFVASWTRFGHACGQDRARGQSEWPWGSPFPPSRRGVSAARITELRSLPGVRPFPPANFHSPRRN